MPRQFHPTEGHRQRSMAICRPADWRREYDERIAARVAELNAEIDHSTQAPSSEEEANG